MDAVKNSATHLKAQTKAPSNLQSLSFSRILPGSPTDRKSLSQTSFSEVYSRVEPRTLAQDALAMSRRGKSGKMESLEFNHVVEGCNIQDREGNHYSLTWWSNPPPHKEEVVGCSISEFQSGAPKRTLQFDVSTAASEVGALTISTSLQRLVTALKNPASFENSLRLLCGFAQIHKLDIKAYSCASDEFEPDTRQDCKEALHSWLKQKNVPIEQWDESKVKGFRHLLSQVSAKESRLTSQLDGVYLDRRVVFFDLYCPDVLGHNVRLIEDRQVLASGFVNRRTRHGGSPAETLHEHEAADNGVRRGIREELSINSSKRLESKAWSRWIEESDDYPGIYCRTIYERFRVDIHAKDLKAEYVEESPNGKKTYFSWFDVSLNRTLTESEVQERVAASTAKNSRSLWSNALTLPSRLLGS